MKQNLTELSDDKLIQMLMDKNPITVCNAICEIAKSPLHSSNERDELIKLCDNKETFWNNYLISDFAEAALDIIGVQKYIGDRNEVKQLIESKLVF